MLNFLPASTSSSASTASHDTVSPSLLPVCCLWGNWRPFTEASTPTAESVWLEDAIIARSVDEDGSIRDLVQTLQNADRTVRHSLYGLSVSVWSSSLLPR